MMIPPVSISTLEGLFGRLDLRGVGYGLGAKADLKSTNPHSNGHLSTPPETLSRIDCSGFVRYAIYQATGGFALPDGSQNQREWCEERHAEGRLHRVINYADVNRYMTDKRLFIAFIKPWTNGCGSVGHVWFVGQCDRDADADTMESHGGKGIDSRSWSYRTLRNQVYSVYELPATA